MRRSTHHSRPAPRRRQDTVSRHALLQMPRCGGHEDRRRGADRQLVFDQRTMRLPEACAHQHGDTLGDMSRWLLSSLHTDAPSLSSVFQSCVTLVPQTTVLVFTHLLRPYLSLAHYESHIKQTTATHAHRLSTLWLTAGISYPNDRLAPAISHPNNRLTFCMPRSFMLNNTLTRVPHHTTRLALSTTMIIPRQARHRRNTSLSSSHYDCMRLPKHVTYLTSSWQLCFRGVRSQKCRSNEIQPHSLKRCLYICTPRTRSTSLMPTPRIHSHVTHTADSRALGELQGPSGCRVTVAQLLNPLMNT